VNELFGDVKVEKEVESRRAEWLRKFRRGFVYNFGQHMLICGQTGSGKTQTMFWLVDELKTAEERGKKKEAIIWFDTGKSDAIKGSTEFLTLLNFGDLNVLVPKGCEVHIQNEDIADMIKIQEFKIGSFWDKIERRRINVACIEPFLRRDPVLYGKVFVELFTQLIDKAHNLEIKTPMAIFFDEFHRICPPRPQDALTSMHYKLGSIIQLNIERLRSLGVRFIASTHGITKMRGAIRSSFQWRIYKRYIGGLSDEDRLKDYKPLLMRLREDEAIISYPNAIFSDIITLPYYGYFGGLAKYYGEITDEFVECVRPSKQYNKKLVTDKQYVAVNLDRGRMRFDFSADLLKELDELDITENRVSVRLLTNSINGTVPIKFIFDEKNGRYGLTEDGRIHCMEFFREYNLVGLIKGRSFKVEINPEEKSVTAYWKPLKPLS